MSFPLLATKLYIPASRPELIPRSRLMERLNQGLTRPLTLVSAPAGFGKTMLVAAWLHQQAAEKPPSLKFAWLSLEPADNDPTRFFSYFMATLQQLEPALGQAALEMLQVGPQLPPLERLLTGLINDLTALPGPLLLVLDDYHLIEAQVIHEALAFFLDHLPPSLHLLLISRSDPPLPLARLRVRGQLAELRAADLRFTPDEAQAFLTGAMRLPLSPEAVAALEARTEGWIAGLQLAALALQGEKLERIPEFIEAFAGSHRYLVDYLAEELLNRQPPELQTFLLQTSILDHLNGSLCDAVTGEQGVGQATLETLERANLLIVPLDNERRWYRYHHLFSDFLHSRLQHTWPERIPELHRRAGEWYLGQGLITEAIDHLLAAQNFDRAALLIEQNAHLMVSQGKLSPLRGWLEALPAGRVEQRPRLGLAYAWSLIVNGQTALAEARLQEVERLLVESGEQETEILGEVAAIRAILPHLQVDLSQAIELSQRMLEGLPPDNLYLRGLVMMNLSFAYRFNGQVEAARQACLEAWQITQKAGPIFAALGALYNLAEIEALQGHLHRAAETHHQALQVISEQGGPQAVRSSPMTCLAQVGLGQLHYEWNDLETAIDHLQAGIKLGQQFGHSPVLVQAYVSLARIKRVQGELPAALDLLQQAEQMMHRSNMVRLLALIPACRVELWLSPQGGDLAAAARWAEAYPPADELDYMREGEHLALARVLIALGQADKALRLLDRLRQAAEREHRTGSLIAIQVHQTLAYQAQGNSTQALGTLAQAVSLAQPGGYIRTFVDQGQPLADLLSRLKQESKTGTIKAYIRQLLNSFGPLEPVKTLTASLIDPLSERELEVLHLIVDGATNQEIAQELVLAIGTVKKHISNIFAKLDVSNRTQAVARARELDLIDN